MNDNANKNIDISGHTKEFWIWLWRKEVAYLHILVKSMAIVYNYVRGGYKGAWSIAKRTTPKIKNFIKARLPARVLSLIQVS